MLAGAAHNGAKLIVMENLYMYGPHNGAPMSEDTPMRGHGSRSTTRVKMTEELFVALLGEEGGATPRVFDARCLATLSLIDTRGVAPLHERRMTK